MKESKFEMACTPTSAFSLRSSSSICDSGAYYMVSLFVTYLDNVHNSHLIPYIIMYNMLSSPCIYSPNLLKPTPTTHHISLT